MEIILAKIVTILLLAGSFALICAGLFRRKLKLSQLSGKLLLLSISGLASYAIIVALAIWKWNSAGGSVIIAGVCSYAPAVALYRILIKDCNGVQREHNKKLNNGLPILHKVPPKRDYGRYFCIMAEKGGTSHGGLTEKLSLFFHAKKQEVNAYGR